MRLDGAGQSEWADRLFAERPLAPVRQAAARGINAPLSSSVGRLFDAFAAVLGICAEAQSYEGEAEMRLEAMARRATGNGPELRFASHEGEIDPAPIWVKVRAALTAETPPTTPALAFHAGLARAFAAPARALVKAGAARAVALAGGCFQNALLHELTLKALGDVTVLTHRTTPANDGGLALGQAAVAAARALRGAESN